MSPTKDRSRGLNLHPLDLKSCSRTGTPMLRCYSKTTVMFSDRQVFANSADTEQTADQGLHYLSFRLHLLDALPYGQATLFKF